MMRTAFALAAAIAGASAAKLRGSATNYDIADDEHALRNVFFDANGKPTIWFWVGIGLVVLVFLICMIACCSGKKKDSTREITPVKRAGDPWLGVGVARKRAGETYQMASGASGTFQGALIRVVQQEHPSHAGGKGARRNDDLRFMVVGGDVQKVTADNFNSLYRQLKVGQKVILRVVREGETRTTDIEVDVRDQAENHGAQLNYGATK